MLLWRTDAYIMDQTLWSHPRMSTTRSTAKSTAPSQTLRNINQIKKKYSSSNRRGRFLFANTTCYSRKALCYKLLANLQWDSLVYLYRTNYGFLFHFFFSPLSSNQFLIVFCPTYITQFPLCISDPFWGNRNQNEPNIQTKKHLHSIVMDPLPLSL